MRKSWNSFFRRIASVCFVCGATAWSSAMCYAQLAADTATDPVYADGWQAGDNGGFGFGPWNFTGTYNTPIGQAIDTGLQAGGTGSSQFNNIGRAWTLFNANGPNDLGPPGPEGDGTDNPPSGGTDISQAGRAILGNLQVGTTISAVIDNPIERRFFGGYTIRLNTGGGNTVFMGTPVSRLAIGVFDYGPPPGDWDFNGADTTLFDTTTDGGVRIDVTLTSVDTFNLVMTPLDALAPPFTASGTLAGPAGSPIDWIEFELFNTDSDFYPSGVTPASATDFYINGLQIIPEPHSAWLLLMGSGCALVAARVRKRKS